VNSRRYPNLMRRAATIAAIILALGQAIAAAHFHRLSAQQELSANGVAGIADSSCAICAAHFHSPAASAVVPALNAPATVRSIVICAVHTGPLSTFIRNRFGRAPPASV